MLLLSLQRRCMLSTKSQFEDMFAKIYKGIQPYLVPSPKLYVIAKSEPLLWSKIVRTLLEVEDTDTVMTKEELDTHIDDCNNKYVTVINMCV